MIEHPPLVEQSPPDIGPYRHGNTGVDYVTTLVADRPGPNVVINALMHGNELSGAIAVDTLFRLGIRPLRGSLTLAFANVEAHQRFDPARPYASRFIDEDMNRIWAPRVLDSSRTSVELRRARALRPIYEQADLLLDLHSMTNDTAPLTLCGQTVRGQRLAAALGHPGWIVADAGHDSGRRLLDHERFSAPDGTATALLVECGEHWRTETAATALEVSLRFLLALGMIDPELAAPYVPERTAAHRLVEVTEAVTVHHDDFAFIAPLAGLEIIPRAGTVIARDGGRAVVTPYDDCVLIMPAKRVKPGNTAVRLGRIIETGSTG